MTSVAMFAISLGAGFLASGVNAVAGGGSLISFPLLSGAGLSAKVANATNSVGLWPGSLSGALSFLPIFKKAWPRVKWLILPTVCGALIGSCLLLATPSKLFDFIIPFILLFAVGLLSFQKKIKEISASGKWRISKVSAWYIQLAIAIYGGYFGAGMGIMMLAVLSLYIDGNLHDLNAVKNWLGMLVNFSITFVFVAKGIVVFSAAFPMIFGSVVGGYLMGRLSQRLDPDLLRKYIVGYGLISVIYFTLNIFPALHRFLHL